MKKHWSPTRLLISALIIIIVTGTWVSAEPENTVLRRIVILPVHIVSDQDWEFVKEGLDRMMASRLSVQGKLEVVSRVDRAAAVEKFGNESTEALTKKIAADLNADYIVNTTLTDDHTGMVSVQINLIDCSTMASSMAFYKENVGFDQLVPLFSLLSEKMRRMALGQKNPVDRLTGESRTEAFDIHAHPDSLIKHEREQTTPEVDLENIMN